MLKKFYPERNDDDDHDGNGERCFKPSQYNCDWIKNTCGYCDLHELWYAWVGDPW